MNFIANTKLEQRDTCTFNCTLWYYKEIRGGDKNTNNSERNIGNSERDHGRNLHTNKQIWIH